jgi:hypothetical protein
MILIGNYTSAGGPVPMDSLIALNIEVVSSEIIRASPTLIAEPTILKEATSFMSILIYFLVSLAVFYLGDSFYYISISSLSFA